MSEYIPSLSAVKTFASSGVNKLSNININSIKGALNMRTAVIGVAVIAAFAVAYGAYICASAAYNAIRSRFLVKTLAKK